jgi:hypothetical protein
MPSPKSGGANKNQGRHIQLSLACPMGSSDNWSLILDWLFLMLALIQTESLPGTHATTQTFYCIILFSSHSTL